MNTPIPNPPAADDADLPPFPEKPDCCFGGCANCVLDGYAEDVADWHKRVAEIRARREAERAAQDPHR